MEQLGKKLLLCAGLGICTFSLYSGMIGETQSSANTSIKADSESGMHVTISPDLVPGKRKSSLPREQQGPAIFIKSSSGIINENAMEPLAPKLPDVAVKNGPELRLILPKTVVEGKGFINGTVHIEDAASKDLTIQLGSDDVSRIGIPALVILPAGKNHVKFRIMVFDNIEINENDYVKITADRHDYTSTSSRIRIEDDEQSAESIISAVAD